MGQCRADAPVRSGASGLRTSCAGLHWLQAGETDRRRLEQVGGFGGAEVFDRPSVRHPQPAHQGAGTMALTVRHSCRSGSCIKLRRLPRCTHQMLLGSSPASSSTSPVPVSLLRS